MNQGIKAFFGCRVTPNIDAVDGQRNSQRLVQENLSLIRASSAHATPAQAKNGRNHQHEQNECDREIPVEQAFSGDDRNREKRENE
jgi:hypothetical protein